MIAGSSDKTIRFLEIGTLDEISRCKMDKKSVNCVAISEMGPNGEEPVIISGGKDSQIQVWNPLESVVEKNISLPTTDVRSLAIFQGSQTYVVVGTKDGKVIVWDINSDEEVAVFKGHKASIHCVCIASFATDLDTQNDIDYLCVASGSADRTVRTWDFETGKKKKKFRHKRSISSMMIANKAIRPVLATAGVEMLILLWDLETGVLLRSLDGHLDQINCLALWEGYEMLVITGSSDHTIRVYDILSGECLCVLIGHTEAVLGLTIANREDPVIVSCSDDLSLIEWSLTDIICEYFSTDDENLGCRNDTAAYLPKLNYTPPEEFDKKSTSKEERKRLKKEMKRRIRLKAQEAAFGISLETLANEMNDDWSEDEYENEDESERPNVDKTAECEEGGEEDDDDGALLVRSPTTVTTDTNTGETSTETTETSSTGLSFNSRVAPDDATGALRRASSITVVQNVMGKILGFGKNIVEVGPESNLERVSSGEKEVTNGDGAGGGDKVKVKDAIDVPPNVSSRFVRTESTKYTAKEEAAKAVQNFNVAEVENQLEAERTKMEAAEKLKIRLKLKKGVMAFKKEGQGDSEERTSLEDREKLEKEKAVKLAQYKMQDKRRKQSMMQAKERSKGALQKRLDELAEKKKQKQLEAFLEEDDDEEDNSSEDDE